MCCSMKFEQNNIDSAFYFNDSTQEIMFDHTKTFHSAFAVEFAESVVGFLFPGIDRLMKQGVYVAAYPLHEVRFFRQQKSKRSGRIFSCQLRKMYISPRPQKRFCVALFQGKYTSSHSILVHGAANDRHVSVKIPKNKRGTMCVAHPCMCLP